MYVGFGSISPNWPPHRYDKTSILFHSILLLLPNEFRLEVVYSEK